MIKVLLFAANRESIGKEQVEVEKSNISVSDLKKVLESEYPGSSFQHAMAAINESFVPDDEIVKAGDTVAFIPPVSGG
ncbi:molybdopterin converting factor subunit 1 [Bacillus sp. SJS]|uniref:molybdopterin converting factor subunit 1 n=1 Tax=Bacillus sp. SJS TaxID=1423321 RepID=UPI0004DD3A1D|nr:molybdopterin converting factor subunit 1 [Bacillus sp. SJS]KZZ82660.1 molybdopterin synthase sulfur carrier subunit [Bacillus sp. SJS]